MISPDRKRSLAWSVIQFQMNMECGLSVPTVTSFRPHAENPQARA